MGLNAGKTGTEVAHLEVIGSGGDNLSDAEAPHNIAQLHCLNVALLVGYPAFDRRINRKIVEFDGDLAILGFWNGIMGNGPGVSSRNALGGRCEANLCWLIAHDL